MGKVLFIAGHGKRKNGSFDSGAVGKMGMGEHEYFSKHLFPMMKRLTNDERLVLFSDYNVFSHGNIVSLSNGYGKDTQVIECHFDSASNELASGGHVIISSSYNPDRFDIDLINAINKTVGINKSYRFKNHVGLSGRSDLGNVNRCRSGKVSYRLIELGFGSNEKDSKYMLNNLETIATELLKSFNLEINKLSKQNNKLYRVQVGAFKNKQNAINLSNELKSKGYDNFITE